MIKARFEGGYYDGRVFELADDQFRTGLQLTAPDGRFLCGRTVRYSLARRDPDGTRVYVHEPESRRRSTEQIKAAPRGAVYIAPAEAVYRHGVLAFYLDRADLLVVSRHWIGPENLSADRRAIVVDHAAGLTAIQRDLLQASGRPLFLPLSA